MLISKLNKINKKSKAIKFILENKDALILEKKNSIKNNIVLEGIDLDVDKNLQLKSIINNNVLDINKAKKELNDNEAIVTFIANTYLWMDSHEDVHDKNIFKKTIKERKNKIFHLLDHDYKLQSKIGKIIEIKEINVNWIDLGVEKEGTTQILVVVSKISKDANPYIYEEYINKNINQHSVGMWYVKLELAINDNSEANKQHFKIWIDNIDRIGNKEKAEKAGYFWLIKEAGLREISGVLRGSNELTHTIDVETNKSTPQLKSKKNKKDKKKKKLKKIKKILKQL